MKTYDWIIVGGGITGSILSYELAKKGYCVLLLEKDGQLNNATTNSYGGLAYWSGTNKLTRQLCQEGIEIHRNLSAELGGDTEFREIDLTLTVNAEEDPEKIAQNYTQFAILPEILNVKEACQLEPLLNPNAIAGVLKLPHGHINPHKTNEAYQQAFLRLKGEIKIEPAIQLLRQDNIIEGVETPQEKYYAKNTVICAGGLSRSLLQEVGIQINLYFTHAHLIRTPPVDIKLRTIVMPAQQQRFILEAEATKLDWEKTSQQIITSILDPGAIQFQDGSLCLGQISQILTDPKAKIDAIASENQIRTEVGKILPTLAQIPGTWQSCLVAFANNSLALVGEILPFQGIYLFSGFTSTLVFAPPLARHFVNWVTGENDEIMQEINLK